MARSRRPSFTPQLTRSFFPGISFACFLIAYCVNSAVTFAQGTAPQPPAEKTAPAQASGTPADSSEVTTRDTPPSFKVRVNLVLVRTVVRDRKGQVVTGLSKEDFQLTDNRKPQSISSFSVESPESHKVTSTTVVANNSDTPNSPAEA